MSGLDITLKDLVLVILGTALGALISIAIYFKQKNRKNIAYAIRTSSLISQVSGPRNVKVVFKGEEIRNVWRHRYIIWNSGNQTILKDDITRQQPIRISKLELHEHRFLDAELAFSSRQEIGIGIAERDNFVEIQFDYLDPEDGLIIDLFFEKIGENDPARLPPDLLGTVRGGERRFAISDYEIALLTGSTVRDTPFALLAGLFMSASGLYMFTKEGITFGSIFTSTIGLLALMAGTFSAYWFISNPKVPRPMRALMKDLSLL